MGIGKKRAEQLAKSFDIHPAIIMFPEYEAKEIEKAAYRPPHLRVFSFFFLKSKLTMGDVCIHNILHTIGG
jgi:hypothetical protein